MNDNENMLMAVAAIAVAALIGRIIINRHAKGGINWTKLGLSAAAGIAFCATMALTDSYRLTNLAAGEADDAEAVKGECVGRRAGADIRRVESMEGAVPMAFAVEAAGVEHTGYWKQKASAGSDDSERQVMVNKNDSSQVIITHKTNRFDISRHPADESACVGVYKLTLGSGERVLALMDAPDAHEGLSPVSRARVLEGKLAEIAAQDSTLNQNVCVESFDSQRYAATATQRLLTKAIAGLLAAIAAVVLGLAGIRLFGKK